VTDNFFCTVICVTLIWQLDKVLDFLNIQIENPCVVLDQENSKTFLKGSPHDKYKFFLRATGLCQYYLLTYNYLSMLIIVMLLFHSTISHYCSCAYSYCYCSE
jgi:hypothetical protein